MNSQAEKKKDQLLIAAGCLTQRYGEEVVEKVPGIDGLIGTRRWMDILQVVGIYGQMDHPKPIIIFLKPQLSARIPGGDIGRPYQGAAHT